MSEIRSLQVGQSARSTPRCVRRAGHALVATVTLACSTACGIGLAFAVAPAGCATAEDELVETKACTSAIRQLSLILASTTVGAPAPTRRRARVSTGAASSKSQWLFLPATHLLGAGVGMRC